MGLIIGQKNPLHLKSEEIGMSERVMRNRAAREHQEFEQVASNSADEAAKKAADELKAQREQTEKAHVEETNEETSDSDTIDEAVEKEKVETKPAVKKAGRPKKS